MYRVRAEGERAPEAPGIWEAAAAAHVSGGRPRSGAVRPSGKRGPPYIGPSQPSTFVSHPFFHMPHLGSQNSMYILQTQSIFYVSLSCLCPSLRALPFSIPNLQELAPRCVMEPFPDSHRQAGRR